jgi:hypothetical protein
MGVTPIYNIPFAEPTDLVRDWPGLSEDVAEAVEAAIAGVPVLAGIGSNVVQTVKTDVFSTTSATFANVTGLTATITPSSATAKVLVIAQVIYGISDDDTDAGHLRLDGGGADTFVGDAASSRVRTIVSVRNTPTTFRVSGTTLEATFVYLSSPASASPVTYAVQARRGSSGTFYVNRSGADADNDTFGRGASSITVIEVAA